MAGLGFKDFQVGEVLTSADVDGYLMQQAVMRFADSGARGSALGTAAGTGVALAEGMVSYLDDADRLEVYDGSAWTVLTRLLNVASSLETGAFTTASTTFTEVTNSGVTVTPKSATSKFVVIGGVGDIGHSAGTTTGTIRIVRDATSIAGDAEKYLQLGSNLRDGSLVLAAVDSPATTSSVTYKLEAKTGSGTVRLVSRYVIVVEVQL